MASGCDYLFADTDSWKIVTLPYPLLLQKSAREALGLSLKGHVVIIDEAHNLMDVITNIYSINVSLEQLQRARAQLGVYLQKFRNRLKGKNRVYVTQIVRLVDSMSGFLQTMAGAAGQTERVVNPSDLMAGKGVDQINLYRLMRYLQDSKLARKVEGYLIHTERQVVVKDDNNQTNHVKERSIPVLTHIQGFLHALTNLSVEGRIFYAKSDKDEACLKYMLLDPTYHFQEIVEEARSVILAGGTMSPVGFLEILYHGRSSDIVADERLYQSSSFIHLPKTD